VTPDSVIKTVRAIHAIERKAVGVGESDER